MCRVARCSHTGYNCPPPAGLVHYKNLLKVRTRTCALPACYTRILHSFITRHGINSKQDISGAYSSSDNARRRGSGPTEHDKSR
jgi:hypothetical protein